MASSASIDAAEIRRRGRQRLIGAVAIVLLLVVFVPMLLDSEPRKAPGEPPLDIPSKDTAAPLPPPTPAPPGAARPSTPAPAESPAPASPPVPAAPAGSEAASNASKAPDSASSAAEPARAATVTPAKDATKGAEPANPTKAAAPKLEGFAVQVGAFREEAKLQGARDKLAAAGIPHYTERLDTAAGPLTRLRAGPFPSRDAAEAAAAKLKQAGLASQVVPLP